MRRARRGFISRPPSTSDRGSRKAAWGAVSAAHRGLPTARSEVERVIERSAAACSDQHALGICAVVDESCWPARMNFSRTAIASSDATCVAAYAQMRR